MYSSNVLTPHKASMNDPEAGLGMLYLGGWAQQWLAWKLKVERSSKFLVDNLCFIHKHLLQKEKIVLGRNWSQTAQTKIVLYGAPSLYGLTP
jgi:hypothetical protein